MNIPTLLTLALVLAYPIYYAAYLSFHKVSLAELRRGIFPFVGLANYERIFDDPLFLLALKNTLIFTAFSVTVEIVLAIAIALLINQTALWTSADHEVPDPGALRRAADRQRTDLVVHLQFRIRLPQPHPVHHRAYPTPR